MNVLYEWEKAGNIWRIHELRTGGKPKACLAEQTFMGITEKIFRTIEQEVRGQCV